LGKKDSGNYSWGRRIWAITVGEEGLRDLQLVKKYRSHLQLGKKRIGDLHFGKEDWGIYSWGRRILGSAVGEEGYWEVQLGKKD
jgi:hypothetical protein